ncbi:hypothetical protein Ddye_003490 [Dipteronia dyeriana]|uniref:CCHC-type domain-containing protein n=1 Tax=Dipteronia dyeriana TaxID=168575 RepID=A0AAE0CVF0_9ROSI|nr:hypothetical protein Ddye_003490 [Dipteronia dyeriana]
MDMESGKGGEINSTAKRARAEHDMLGRNDIGVANGLGSFKSKLMCMSTPSSWSGLGTSKEKLKIDPDGISISEGPNGPMMKLSPKLKEQLHKPWVNALILKNMGRSHTLNFMLSKLTQKWSLIGHWQLTHLGDGYFVARFQMKEDLDYVLTSGPWVIANQYLVVQRWNPNFVPDLLWNIGGMLGRMCKVDPVTETQARGRFARIYVEIDISKPLLSTLSIDDRSIRVEYESLGLVCFKCGRYGHSKDNCRESLVELFIEDINNNDIDEANSKKEDSMYGPWLLVSHGKQGNRGFKGRSGRMGNGNASSSDKIGVDNKIDGSNFNRKKDSQLVDAQSGKNFPLKSGNKVKNTDMAKNLDTNKGSGSRFDILNEDIQVMMAEGEVHSKSKVSEGNSKKNKIVLTEITNQSSKLGETLSRVSAQNSTNNIKKSDKLVCNVNSLSQLSIKQRGTGSSKGRTSSYDKKKPIQIVTQYREKEMTDSDDVFWQSHIDTAEFEAHCIEGRVADDRNCNKSAVQNEINFGVVASELEEAMAVISRLYQFGILAIFEPRISCSKALRVIRNLGFSNSFVVDAEGFSGGIWLLWNNSQVELQVIANTRHCITALVDDHSSVWVLTVVYANPCATTRSLLWNYLDSIRKCFNLPWLIDGDFNEITNSSEKEVEDSGFIGPKFTWMTKRGIGEEIWERLDRAICSTEWRLRYAECYVRHLPRVLSDHCPVLIQLYSNHTLNSKCKPFRFEAMWLKHKKFDEIFLNNWSTQGDMTDEKIYNLSRVLQKWNKEEFGNLFHNKRRLLAHIHGIQKCLSERFSHHLSLLEETLLNKYKDTLEHKEIFWKQKSRNCWLNEGDKNTKFFHLSTIIRRRRNKIEGFKKVDGRWVDGMEEMKQEAVGYFQKLFEVNHSTSEQVLDEVGIVGRLNNLIMSCVSSVQYKVILNGELSDRFNPRSGIRQGDPLSPYIFVLCMEKLSHIINPKLMEGDWTPVKVSRGGPGLTMKNVHLVLNWGGEWKNHHGKHWYEGQRAKAFNFPRDSNYDQLLGKVYNVTGIDRDHYRVSMTTLPQTFRPSMPIEIIDDEDVALLLRRENVDPLFCISVEEIGHETPKMKHQQPESSHNLHHVTPHHEFHYTHKSNIQVSTMDEFERPDDIREGLQSSSRHFSFEDTMGNLSGHRDEETETQFNYIPERVSNRYDEQFAHVQRLVPPPCKKQLKSQLGKYALANRFQIRVFKSDTTRYQHTCSTGARFPHQRQTSARVIGEHIQEKFRDHRSYNPKEIIHDMQREFGISCNYHKGNKAVKQYFRRAVRVYRESQFRQRMEQLEYINPEAVQYVTDVGIER